MRSSGSKCRLSSAARRALVPVILLLQLLHLTLQQQQLLASDGSGGGVQRVAEAKPLSQGADLCLQGRPLLQTQWQLPEQEETSYETLQADRKI